MVSARTRPTILYLAQHAGRVDFGGVGVACQAELGVALLALETVGDVARRRFVAGLGRIVKDSAVDALKGIALIDSIAARAIGHTTQHTGA